MTRITGNLCGDQYTFMIISLPFLLRIRNVSHKSYREAQNTHFTSNNFFFFENLAVYEIMLKTIVEPGRPHDMTVWPMRFVHFINKASGTHSEYVKLIAFPPQ
jgi:hypothetical protein